MNHSRNRKHAAIAVAGAVMACGAAFAQDSGKVMIDVADCIKLEAAEARLACYESRVAAVFGERAAQAAAVRPAAPAQAPVAAARPPEPTPVAPPVATAPPAAPPAAPRAASAAPVTAPAATEPVKARGDRQSRREEKEQAAAEAVANDIVSRVKDVREVVPNAWQITLENGQVWRQTVSKHYELRPGDDVRIYGTHWGSASRLTSERVNGYIQVERLH